MHIYSQNQPIPANTWLPLSMLSNLQITWDTRSFGPGSTLLIYDLDAPSNLVLSPSRRRRTTSTTASSTLPYLHMLITNIQGNDVSTGTALLPLDPPHPPPGPDHRYVVALYTQPRVISVATPARSSFPLDTFVAQN